MINTKVSSSGLNVSRSHARSHVEFLKPPVAGGSISRRHSEGNLVGKPLVRRVADKSEKADDPIKAAFRLAFTKIKEKDHKHRTVEEVAKILAPAVAAKLFKEMKESGVQLSSKDMSIMVAAEIERVTKLVNRHTPPELTPQQKQMAEIVHTSLEVLVDSQISDEHKADLEKLKKVVKDFDPDSPVKSFLKIAKGFPMGGWPTAMIVTAGATALNVFPYKESIIQWASGNLPSLISAWITFMLNYPTSETIAMGTILLCVGYLVELGMRRGLSSTMGVRAKVAA